MLRPIRDTRRRASSSAFGWFGRSLVGHVALVIAALGPVIACTFDSSGLGEPDDLNLGSGTSTTSGGGGEATVSAVTGDDSEGDPGTTGESGESGESGEVTAMTATESGGPGGDGTCDEPETFYYDMDDDGFGDSMASVSACEPPPGYVAVGGDCDDSDPTIHPGALELCNGVDDDCDGAIDEYSAANAGKCGGCTATLAAELRVYYLCDDNLSEDWQRARMACKRRGADLVAIGDTAEQLVVEGLLTGAQGLLWIGANDLAMEFMYEWTDGTPLPTNNPYWAPGEPQSDPNEPRRCGVIGALLSGHTGRYAMHPCKPAIDLPWICEGLADPEEPEEPEDP